MNNTIKRSYKHIRQTFCSHNTQISVKVKTGIKKFQNRVTFKVPMLTVPCQSRKGTYLLLNKNKVESTLPIYTAFGLFPIPNFPGQHILNIFPEMGKKDWISLQLVSCRNSSTVPREITASPDTIRNTNFLRFSQRLISKTKTSPHTFDIQEL